MFVELNWEERTHSGDIDKRDLIVNTDHIVCIVPGGIRFIGEEFINIPLSESNKIIECLKAEGKLK